MKKTWICLVALLVFVACKKENNFVDYDLIKHGLSLKIKAPIDPEVKVVDMGIAKDVTIKKGDNYSIQIISSSAITYDVKSLIAEKKSEVESGPYFSQIVFENENGFVFEKKISEENINYDFRAVRILGDIEYDFQTGLLGKFTKEDVLQMFKAIE